MGRFFLNGNGFTILIELNNTETLRVIHIVAKHCGTLTGFRILHSSFQTLFQAVSCKNVVTQYHCHSVITNKISTNDKRLCQSIRGGLNSIGKVNTKLMSVTQQILKTRRVLRCGNDQNIPDTRIHKNRHRVINHWLVVNRKQLL